jgi:actin-related protein
MLTALAGCLYYGVVVVENPCFLYFAFCPNRLYPTRTFTRSGGSSMYPGLPTRLEKDIKDRYLKEVLKGEFLRLRCVPALLLSDSANRLVFLTSMERCCSPENFLHAQHSVHMMLTLGVDCPVSYIAPFRYEQATWSA